MRAFIAAPRAKLTAKFKAKAAIVPVAIAVVAAVSKATPAEIAILILL